MKIIKLQTIKEKKMYQSFVINALSLKKKREKQKKPFHLLLFAASLTGCFRANTNPLIRGSG